MKKLELKYIAPYLPYGLKLTGGHGNIHELDAGKIERVCIPEYNWKPILRPLSDLTKEIDHNGEKLVPLDKIGSMRKTGYPWDWYEEDSMLGSYDSINRCIKGATLIQYQKLFEWHFDVFGLIPEGLAIDINTLK